MMMLNGSQGEISSQGSGLEQFMSVLRICLSLSEKMNVRRCQVREVQSS